MTLTLNLAPDVEAALEAAAKQNGRTPAELIDEAVRIFYLPSALTMAVPDAEERLAMAAEGMRHVWDTPEEDAAWSHL